MRFLIGNPLIMKEMVKHVPDAGSYAPITILVDERSDGVYVSYDRMESFRRPYGNQDAFAAARNLDTARAPASANCRVALTVACDRGPDLRQIVKSLRPRDGSGTL